MRIGFVQQLDQQRALDDAPTPTDCRLNPACGHAMPALVRGVPGVPLACLPLGYVFVVSMKRGLAPVTEGFVTGAASPSAPIVRSRGLQSLSQRVFTRQQPESDRNLPSPGHPELLAEDVAVRLRRSWRDAEHEPHFLVGEALGDQLHHFPLPGGDA